MEGRVLDGRYRLDRLLGSGGSGVVYCSTDLSNNKTVAIKVLHEERQTTAHTRSRFMREGKALAKLSHPHIVEVFGFGIANEIPFIIMEYLEGQTLENLLEPLEPLDFDLAITIIRQMLDALAFAHKAKVVHRDLKPANIFLQRSEDAKCHIKLLDFGLAKFLAPDDYSIGQTLTKTGMVMGTPLYMAPEQAVGGKVDMRVDVYAAGCVLFEMVAGRPPFLKEEHHELVRAHLISPIPRITDIVEGRAKDQELEALIERATAKEPLNRYHDAGAMLRALNALDISSSQMIRYGPFRIHRSHLSKVTKNMKFAIAGILALLLVLLVGYIAENDDPYGELSDNQQEKNRPAPVNPWLKDGIPPELSQIFSRIEKEQIINTQDIKNVHSYTRNHPGDARPFLLLARGFANQHWRRDSINRYLRAYRVDKSSRGDPRMLSDLLDFTSHEQYGNQACSAIQEIFDKEALSAVEQELEQVSENRTHRERLLDLKKNITR